MIALIYGNDRHYETLYTLTVGDKILSAIKIDEPPELLPAILGNRIVRILDLKMPKALEYLLERMKPPYKGYFGWKNPDEDDIIRFYFDNHLNEPDKILEIYEERQDRLDSLDYYSFYCPLIRLSEEFLDITKELTCVRFYADKYTLSVYKRIKSTIAMPVIHNTEGMEYSCIGTLYIALGAPMVGFLIKEKMAYRDYRYIVYPGLKFVISEETSEMPGIDNYFYIDY